MKKIRLTFIQLLLPLILLIGATGALPACAEEAQAADLTLIAAQKEDSTEALPVEFMNRHIFTIRSGVMGFTQEERAMAIKHRIEAAMEKGGDDHVSVRPTPEDGRFVELNGLAVFQIRPVDLDPLTGESVDEAAKNAAENLKIAVREAREQGNTRVILKGIGFSILASVFFYLACRQSTVCKPYYEARKTRIRFFYYKKGLLCTAFFGNYSAANTITTDLLEDCILNGQLKMEDAM